MTLLRFTLRSLRRRDPWIPRYHSPLGLWKVVSLGLLLGWLADADVPEYVTVLAALVGWAAPVGAARFTAGVLSRERETGGWPILVQAVGEARILAVAVLLGVTGPLLEVALAALLLAPFADSLSGLAVGAGLLALQVLTASVYAAAVALRSRGSRGSVIRRVSWAPVLLYALGLAAMLEEAVRTDGVPSIFRAMPPLVLPCCASGWDATAWGTGLTGTMFLMAMLLLRRARVS